MYENSNLIQVYPSEHMLWKGHEWSRIKCMVKVDEYFRVSFAGQEPKYALRVLLENVSTNEVYSPWKHKRFFRLSFHDGVMREKEEDDGEHKMIKSIAENPYIDMTIEVHKALFKGGDKFRIVVAAVNEKQNKMKSAKDVVFGASTPIVVSNLLLKIEEAFSQHQRITKVSDDMFVYYNKMGELGDGLRVIIHLLNEHGEPSKVHHDLLLKTELVYEDFLPVPILPFSKTRIQSHSNARKRNSQKDKEIFIRMNGDPMIRNGETSTSFNFHLEDVTYHHHGHDGYRIKVSVSQNNELFVCPGIMSEIVAVLSKPKRIHMSTPNSEFDIQKYSEEGHYTPIPKYSTPNVLVQNGDWNEKPITCTNNKRKADDVLREEKMNNGFNEKRKGKKLSVPMHAIYDSFICNGSCFTCHANVTAQTVLIPTSHYIGCKLAETILPVLTSAQIPFTFAIVHDSSAPSTPLPNIATSKSFEECGHSLESINESIFEDSENQPPIKSFGFSKTAEMKKNSSRLIESEVLNQNFSKVYLSEHPASSANVLDDKFILENVLSSSFETDSNENEGLFDPYSEEEALLLIDFANTMNAKIGDALHHYE